jgi:hypothetical protein
MSKNDQRSNAENPDNPAQKAASDNRSNQLNPNNAKTKGGAKKRSTRSAGRRPAGSFFKKTMADRLARASPGVSG